MKSDDCNAPASFESCCKNTQTFLKCAKLVIHFHAQGLKSLRGWMTPTVPTDDFFDGAGERDGFAERGCLPHFNNQARDTTRSRLLPEFAKQAGQLFCAVFVNNSGSGELIPWIHPHIERAITRQAETALRIFELPGGDAQIEERTTDHADPKLVENFVHVAKIRLPHGDALAELCQLLGHMLDRIGILIQCQDVGTTSQKRFRVTPTTAGAINHERTRFGGEQFYDLLREHWTVINKILHFLRLLFDNQRTSREPDRPLRQQRVHNISARIILVTNRSRSLHAGKWRF